MASLVTIGLKGISVAPIGPDGTPGTVFVKLPYTSTDSLSFAESEPTVKTVDVEEVPDPLKRFKTKGPFVVTANLADADTDALALLRGGTVTTLAQKKTYKDGDKFASSMTVKIEPAEGLSFIINNCDIQALISGGLGKNQELFTSLTLTALQPTKAGVAAVEMIETVAV